MEWVKISRKPGGVIEVPEPKRKIIAVGRAELMAVGVTLETLGVFMVDCWCSGRKTKLRIEVFDMWAYVDLHSEEKNDDR